MNKRTKAKLTGAQQIAALKEEVAKLQALVAEYQRKQGVPNLLARFGRYVARRREDANLSIRELASRAQMPHTNVFQIETLKQNPKLTEIQQLAKAFNQPLLDFLRAAMEQPTEAEEDVVAEEVTFADEDTGLPPPSLQEDEVPQPPIE